MADGYDPVFTWSGFHPLPGDGETVQLAAGCVACGTAFDLGDEYVLVDGLPVHLDCSLEDTTYVSNIDAVPEHRHRELHG